MLAAERLAGQLWAKLADRAPPVARARPHWPAGSGPLRRLINIQHFPRQGRVVMGPAMMMIMITLRGLANRSLGGRRPRHRRSKG